MRIRDPDHFLTLDPGWEKNSDPGSAINVPDPQHWSLTTDLEIVHLLGGWDGGGGHVEGIHGQALAQLLVLAPQQPHLTHALLLHNTSYSLHQTSILVSCTVKEAVIEIWIFKIYIKLA
jgi:hypothetical protein